jgi:arylsulfatase A-like enzyme
MGFMNRRSFLKTTCAVSAGLAVNPLSGFSNMNESKPNIIMVLVDDLGYGDLSCLGAKDMRTPHIDNIARQGMTFRNFYANSPVCSPSRASLLTGKYPDHVGVPGVIRQEEEHSWGYLDENAITLPQVLNDLDYHTAMIGKWHLGYEKPNTPNGRGFKHFKGFLGDMMHDYWTHLNKGVNWMRYNDSIIEPEDQKGHATDLFTDWAIDYLNERKGKQRPFFLYLAYNAPHFPIQPPQEWLDKVNQREKNITEKRAKNVALIEHLDSNIGRVMQALEKTGLDENTLIIFASDNGGALEYAQSNGALRGNKQEMYEGGIRVPTYAMWKGRIEPGSTTENLGMLMDLYPTICKIAGNHSLHPIDGISLLPTLLGKNQTTDDRYLFWVRREGWEFGGQAYYAARYKNFKILQNSASEPMQFFNIGDDESEKKPIAKKNNRIFNQLMTALQEHIRKSGAIPWQQQ